LWLLATAPAITGETEIDRPQWLQSLDPDNRLSDAYGKLGDIYRNFGKKDSAEIYIRMGTEALAEKRFDRAEQYFLLAQKYDSNTVSSSTTVTILNRLSETYREKGNPKKMFETAQLAAALHDSLTVAEDKRRLEILQTQNELKEIREQKEMELRMQAEEQQQEISRRRKLIIFSIVILIFLSFLLAKLVLNYRSIRRKNLMLQESHEEMLQIQEQLRLSNNELDMYKEYLEDMVQKKAAEQAQKDMQLYGLGNNLPGGFIYRKVVDRDGKEQLSYISRNVQQLYGVSADTLIGGNNFYSLWGGEEEKFVEELRAKEMEYGQKMTAFRHEFSVVKDGKSIWLMTCAFPHNEKDGSITWDGLVIDITRQKEAERTLEAAKEKAEEADRLKSVFLSNMSHEIRTPMNAIMGFIGFVENENLPSGKRNKYIETIRRSVEQLLKLVENIIDISKLEIQQIKIHPIEFELNVLMRELEESFTGKMPEDKMIHLQLDDSHFLEDDRMFNDRMRLKQVLRNLIENAVKYTEKGYVCFGYRQSENPDELIFFVEDTGIGIPENQQEIIFEYFRQGSDAELKPKYGGTGLGLSISKGLVECMQGRIWVESTLDRGSTFFFTAKKHLIPDS
jgi:PAS domain S-box-containing protein